ncbi:ABC transporter permease [Nonomuraea dietziae]|uniref:ABC-2 type transport system permease protein n=1 Tax=Nonomuraea dietziae TaxID=65515 RepID=A0A7W5UYT2_9ACTN|nr:ABC transporter permease [Nonomuraea dietziae]MBB3724535.1 ABC-2 type transport system permease protein [Nonomuraea dietziae]
MREALWAELLKVRRSRLPWISALAFTVATLVCGLFMFILQDPQRAQALGLLGAKAQLSGATADWTGYLALLAQAVAVGGLLIYGVIAIWLFGREFSDHTAKDLLALPTSRSAIVGAKFIIAGLWSVLLAVQVCGLGLLIGALLGLPGWSGQHVAEGVARVLIAASLTSLLSCPWPPAPAAATWQLWPPSSPRSSPPRSSPHSASAPTFPGRCPACSPVPRALATTHPTS